jgi:hypothetical protein
MSCTAIFGEKPVKPSTTGVLFYDSPTIWENRELRIWWIRGSVKYGINHGLTLGYMT